MDQPIRNRLRSVVTQCRTLLEEAVSQALQGQFGVYASGKKGQVHVEDEERMRNLSDEDRECRGDLLAHLGHIQALGYKATDALAQLVREVAFTHLNRLCAWKMMEAREVWVGGQRFREAVSRGMKSQGFLFYLADHPEDEQRSTTGQQAVAYRHFLGWLCSLLSEEIGVLFSPTDPANRLFPPQRVLDEVLALLNGDDLKDIWAQDETIGWVYQYFTPKEMRDKARSESRSPRNSYELAFRNQFFTPRYVVEFLTDNTLGRTWYEMRKGDTRLKDQCRYMVRRPTEIFLAEGETPPEPSEDQEDLSQEELLKQPVHIPHRPKKDPRGLQILDPACGSGHFLLYCFDLLQTIYEEAYSDPDLGPQLRTDYPTIDDLRRDVPRLILASNLHGIDIDLRATQIAALALWLRCQRAYGEMGLTQHRPAITKSNIVCAEPMPGEKEMLDEFLNELDQERLAALIRRVMALPEGAPVRATEPMVKAMIELIRLVWDRMQLAGEAGSLLKIEEELREAVRKGQEEWEGRLPLFRTTEFSLTEEPKESYTRLVPGEEETFWQRAEALSLEALRDYARHAADGGRLQRRLFAEDAERGFAFTDLCQRRFDVVLMNPPFGEVSRKSKSYIKATYEHSYSDILAAFVERAVALSVQNGLIGAITNRNCFFLTTMSSYRKEVLQRRVGFEALMDLGDGVLDATVEAAIYVLRRLPRPEQATPFVRLLVDDDKAGIALTEVAGVNAGRRTTRSFYAAPCEFARLPSAPFCYWVPAHIIKGLSSLPLIEGTTARINVGLQTGYDWRFLRAAWEVPSRLISPSPRATDQRPEDIRAQCLEELRTKHRWAFFSKTGVASPWYSPISLVVDWERGGEEIRNFSNEKGQKRSAVRNEGFYFRPGYSYMLRSTRVVPYIIPPGVIPTAGRSQIYPEHGWEIEVLGVCASRLGSAVARFGGEKFGWPKFQASMVQGIPAVPISTRTKVALQQRANSELADRRHVLSHFEPWHEFTLPALLDDLQSGDAWQLETLIGTDLEEQIAQDAGLTGDDLKTLCRDLDDAISIRQKSTLLPETEDNAEMAGEGEQGGEPPEGDSISLVDISPRAQHEGSISYCMGVVCGRWDVRFALDRSLIPASPDVLDPLPVVPPGTLVSPDGYPARSQSIVSEEWLRARPNAVYLPATGSVAEPTITDAEYPIRIDWDGVLADDPDHADDVVRRVREVFELVWKGRAEATEREACEILGVKRLRDYFRKPGKGGFWDDHIARYSKSRRKAPIYWLLQSSKKNYALWIYYHRLDRDILFKALHNYVEPKIRLELSRLDSLRSQKSGIEEGAKGAKKIDREIDRQEAFLAELSDFAEKLERAAKLNFGKEEDLDSSVTYDPDLNDGVVLNIAPLWEFVPWKEAKKYWEELLEGKYEWSSMGKLLRKKGLVK